MHADSRIRRFLVVAFAALCTTSASAAGLFRAYLSVKGNAANPCTLVAPCRLLPAALGAVADHGEIWILDSANFNTSQVTIAKSVTVLALPGIVASVVASGGNAMLVNAPGAIVRLRNLIVVQPPGATGSNGISFVAGAELDVEDCKILNMAQTGIDASANGSTVTVVRTVLQGNGVGFNAIGGVTALLHEVVARGNANFGIAFSTGSRGAVSNSVAANNGSYGIIAAASSTNAQVVVTRSTISGGTYGIGALADPGASVNVTADGNALSNNSVGFLLSLTGFSIVWSRGNNTVDGLDSNRTLDSLAGQ